MMRTITILLLVLLCFTQSAKAQDQAYDVFLVAGQSNTLHGCCKDPDLQEVDSAIMQLGRHEDRDLKIIPALEPLEHHRTVKDHIGFAMTFADIYKHNLLKKNRKILLIPCGKGGTGFASGHWNPGDELYEDAIKRTNYVMEKYPKSELKAILWHQGEKDTRENNKNFREDLDRMITQMRKDIEAADENTPFIMGGMVPHWVSQKSRREKYQRFIRKTQDRLPNVYYVSPYTPYTIHKRDNAVDEIHYDAKGQVEMGNRYYSVYSSLVK